MKKLLNLSRINGSIKSFRSSIFGAEKTTSDMRNFLFKKTKVKKEVIQGKKTFWRRKKEYQRRQENESLLEAKEIITSPVKAIMRATGGFLSRILSFLGTLLLGWLMNNLPTIIAMAQELIARIQRMFALLQGFIGNIFNIVKNFGSLLGSIFQNIISLDIFDTSNRVKNSLTNLENTFTDMGKQIDEGIRLATTSLNQSIAPGGPGSIPPAGTDYTMQPSDEVNVETLGAATDLKSGARAFLNAGFPARGAAYLAGNVQQESGWRGQRSPWVLDDGAGTNKGLMSWNRGRITNAEKFLGKPLNKASNAEQIRWIKHEMKTYYSSAYNVFMNPNATDAELQRASYTYLGYGDVGARFKYAQEALKSLESSGVDMKAPGRVVSSNESISSPIPSQAGLPPLPRTNTIPGQNYGDSRNGGSRRHAGQDFDISGNEKFYSRIGGTVVGSPFRFGADGWAIDIYNKSLGVYERIAEAQRILVKPGQTVQPGQAVAQGESGTGVIHYEIRKTQTGGFDGSLNPIKFLSSLNTQNKPTPTPITPAPKSTPPTSTAQATPTTTVAPSAPSITPTPSTAPSAAPPAPAAQVSSTSASQQVAQTIQTSTTPQQQTIFINDVQQPQPIMASSGGGNVSPPMTVSGITLLNRFMKHHILLDLAYT